MKYLLLVVSLWIAGAANLVFAQSQPEYSRIKITLNRAEGKDLTALYALGLDVEHGDYTRDKSFISDFSPSEMAIIAAAGFSYEVLIADVVAHYEAQLATQDAPESGCQTANVSYLTPSNFALGSMGGYFTYQEMLNHLDSMAAKFPNLITARQPISTTNLTHDGRPIYWLRLSDNANTDEAEPEMLYDALHHAREPGSLSQLIFYMWYLLENYGTDPEVTYLVDNTELYFVPCVNPDGYIYNQQTNPNGGGLWRKNRRQNTGGSFGVDLNRNYGHEWGHDDVGSSPSQNSATYRGTAAFSEPETQNMRDFAVSRQFKMALNYHTYGNLLIYPWGYSDSFTPDSTTFIQFSQLMTRENRYSTGTGIETVGYTVNGDSDDWMYGEQTAKPKIFSMTPEAGANDFGFWPPSSEILGFCNENIYQNKMAAHLLLNYGEAADQSSEFVANLNGYFHYKITKYGLASGNLTVSVLPVSANITSLNGAPKVYSLTQFQESLDSVSFVLNPNIQSGDEVVFLIKIDNGLWVKTDTIRKYFQTTATLFADDLTANSQWQNNTGNAWNTTTAAFHSAPSSMTDSPNGNYNANAFNHLVSTNPVDLTEATSAKLVFWAKWSIESNYDYAQVGGSATSSINFTPLCGKYTKTGSNNQDPNEPVYDGAQTTWVQEEIDITDFVGSNFYVSFLMRADSWVQLDGFYFDDVAIVVTLPTGTQRLPVSDFHLQQNRPNPATAFTIIPITNAPNDADLVVYNVLGQEIFRTAANTDAVRLATENWVNGVYFYRLESSKEGNSDFKSLVR